jgi:glutamate-ammonia-ligase adenylyltransferase
MNIAATRLPAELQTSVDRWLERYGEAEHVEALARLVTCSEFAGSVVLREKEWFLGNIETFAAAPGTDGLDAFVGADDIQVRLRRFRNRYMLHVLWREVFGLSDLEETLESLSTLADRMLDVAARHAEHSLQPRYGVVRNSVGDKVPLVILGMGKLGGLELNFSSDIDIIFLYSEDGETDGTKCVSAQEYFGRLSRHIIALLDETTVDGFVFRIDTRLRPFGDSGPPVVSFAALESYLLQHGRDWERYAYVKARVVGSRPSDDIISDLHRNLIRPFVYRRYIDFGVFESLREMHALIAEEVKKRELQDNVKLGPGGIREAEFVVQSLQLVRGGSEPTLQSRSLQKVLPLLVGPRGLSAEDANALRDAYRYMRRVENFIQGIRDQQTHDMPSGDSDRARLCVAMNYGNWCELRNEFERHRAAISAQFEHVAFRERAEETPFQKRVEQAWESGADEGAWAELLGAEGYSEAAGMAEVLARFSGNSRTRQIDAAARDRLRRFVPQLVVEIAKAERPVVALSRTVSIVEQVLRRSAVELQQRLTGQNEDAETRMQAIGQFQRSTMFRIALADFNGKLPIMKVSDGLTWLAEVVLEETLRVARRDLVERHGAPRCTDDGVEREAGFGIIAYGKLGGLELSYGSDLDIVFLHDSRGSQQVTDGAKPLDNTMFFSRLVRRLTHFLTTQTGSGQLTRRTTPGRGNTRRCCEPARSPAVTAWRRSSSESDAKRWSGGFAMNSCATTSFPCGNACAASSIAATATYSISNTGEVASATSSLLCSTWYSTRRRRTPMSFSTLTTFANWTR